jgi:hypothetical protein
VLDHEQHSHAGGRRRMMLRFKPDLPADGMILPFGRALPSEAAIRLDGIVRACRGERETGAAAAAMLGAGADVKDAFDAVRYRVAPDLVMTHYLADRHEDYRAIAELPWNSSAVARSVLSVVTSDGRSQKRAAPRHATHQARFFRRNFRICKDTDG